MGEFCTGHSSYYNMTVADACIYWQASDVLHAHQGSTPQAQVLSPGPGPVVVQLPTSTFQSIPEAQTQASGLPLAPGCNMVTHSTNLLAVEVSLSIKLRACRRGSLTVTFLIRVGQILACASDVWNAPSQVSSTLSVSA